MNKLQIKVSSIQATTILLIENEILCQLNGWKTIVSNQSDQQIISRMICMEVFKLLDKFERIAFSGQTRSMTLTYTECVCFYYFLRKFPINDANVLLQITINEFIETLHLYLFC